MKNFDGSEFDETELDKRNNEYAKPARIERLRIYVEDGGSLLDSESSISKEELIRKYILERE